MKLQLPFAKQPKFTPVAVGNDDHGLIYLSKRGGRTGKEREELDQVDEIETKLQLLIYRLIKKIRTDKGLSEDEALEVLFTETSDSIMLADYSDEIEKMLNLKNQAKQYRDLVVTVMIRERILYPVFVMTTAKKGDLRVEVSELDFDIPVNTTIRFGSQMVATSTVLCKGDSVLQLESKLSEDLLEGAVGFVMSSNNKPLVGNPEWELKDTLEVNDPLQDQIFEFYQGELLARSQAGTEKKEQLMKQSKPLKNTKKEDKSTGNTSIGESKDTGLLMPTSGISGTA